MGYFWGCRHSTEGPSGGKWPPRSEGEVVQNLAAVCLTELGLGRESVQLPSEDATGTKLGRAWLGRLRTLWLGSAASNGASGPFGVRRGPKCVRPSCGLAMGAVSGGVLAGSTGNLRGICVLRTFEPFSPFATETIIDDDFTPTQLALAGADEALQVEPRSVQQGMPCQAKQMDEDTIAIGEEFGAAGSGDAEEEHSKMSKRDIPEGEWRPRPSFEGQLRSQQIPISSRAGTACSS